MTIKTDIFDAVDTAWSKFASLHKSATFVTKTASYTFGAANELTTTNTTTTVNVIVVDEAKDADGNRAKYTVYIRTNDIEDIASYDEITIDGLAYSLHSYKDDGFVIEAKLVGTPGGLDHVDV